MDDLALINQSLEQLADCDVDITAAVYARFFAECPEAEALFATPETHMVQGKMLSELVQTVLDRLEQKPYSDTLVTTLVNDHHGWGVTLPMYAAFFEAFLTVLTDTLDARLSPQAHAAWQRALVALQAAVAQWQPSP